MQNFKIKWRKNGQCILDSKCYNQLGLNDAFLSEYEALPLNPTTLSFEAPDFPAPIFPPEDAFLELLAGEDFLLPVKVFTGFDILTAALEDFAGVDAFPDFVTEDFLPEVWDDFSNAALVLFFWRDTFINLAAVFPFCSVILVLATSLRILSLVRASKLSFFLSASSIRSANNTSFLATRLVTFPEKITEDNRIM